MPRAAATPWWPPPACRPPGCGGAGPVGPRSCCAMTACRGASGLLPRWRACAERGGSPSSSRATPASRCALGPGCIWRTACLGRAAGAGGAARCSPSPRTGPGAFAGRGRSGPILRFFPRFFPPFPTLGCRLWGRCGSPPWRALLDCRWRRWAGLPGAGGLGPPRGLGLRPSLLWGPWQHPCCSRATVCPETHACAPQPVDSFAPR